MAGKILIVEDDVSTRETLWVILRNDYQVLLADDGEAALRALENEPEVKLVLLDILLPGIDGIEVLKIIRKRGIKVEVIVISIVREVDTVVKAMKLGALDYITKEFDYDGVLNKVKEAFARIEGKNVS